MTLPKLFDDKNLSAAKALLNRLGVPTNYSGYHFLSYAVVVVYIYSTTNADPKCAFTKEIYPLVAARFKSTVARVERSMRYAIHETWTRGEQTELRALFPAYSKTRPANVSYFLTRLAADLELQLKGS